MGPKPKARSGKAYKLTDVNAEAFKLTDVLKKTWTVGSAVGVGGFGRLYQVTDTSNNTGSNYVVKIEPKDNGPLFSEQSFYQRVAKPNIVHEWMAEHKLKHLGVPLFISSGLHTHDSRELRFLIMPQYGTDLQKKFEECQRVFPLKTVLTIALQLIDVLEFLHSKDYVHADIKASNLLLGLGKGQENHVYLVDYGLAYKYRNDGVHTVYKPDPKRAHDGTLEFTSRDAHAGCSPSRRGDLEILGYCLLQWIVSTLPWENLIPPKERPLDVCIKVMDAKNKFIGSIKDSIKNMKKDVPSCLVNYLIYVSQLEYTQEPDYQRMRQLFLDELSCQSMKNDGKLVFMSPGKATPSKRKSVSVTPVPKKRQKVTKPGDGLDTPQAIVQATANTGKVAKPRGQRKTQTASAKRESIGKAIRDTLASKATSSKCASVTNGANQTASTASKSDSSAKSALQKVKEKTTSGTQTSPGLKGLKGKRNVKTK